MRCFYVLKKSFLNCKKKNNKIWCISHKMVQFTKKKVLLFFITNMVFYLKVDFQMSYVLILNKILNKNVSRKISKIIKIYFWECSRIFSVFPFYNRSYQKEIFCRRHENNQKLLLMIMFCVHLHTYFVWHFHRIFGNFATYKMLNDSL